ALQERLGVRLFARTGRGLRLTEEGERLLDQARASLASLMLFEQAASALSKRAPVAKQPFSIGTILDPDFTRLGEFLKAFVALAPQFVTELRHGISGWVMKELREGRLDFGFYLGAADGERFAVVPVAPVRYVVIAPRGWDAQLAQRDWKGAASLPWIWTPPESVHNRLLAPIF